MLSWFLTSKLLHILAAMLLVGGLLGRNLTFAAARRSGDLPVTASLLGLSERFETLMVRPGSELVLVLGLLTAWLERQPLLTVFAGARPAWVLVSLLIYLLTVPLVVFVLLPRTKRRRLALDAAVAQHSMTAELRGALDDPSVRVARNVELAIILVVIALMVLKPF
jgi:uncharacterized membrane protein